VSESVHNVSHEWVRARFGPWAAGILSEADHQALESHLVTCAQCRKAAGGLGNDVPEEQHIPTTLLARWDRTAPTLTGELRDLVQRHIERCEDCRRELATLGFDPGLIRQPRLEPVPGTSRARVSSPRRPRWTGWHTALSGALATAAGIALVWQTGLMQVASRKPADQIVQRPDQGPTPNLGPENRTLGQTPKPSSRPTEPVAPGGEVPALMALGPWRPDAVNLGETLREGSAATPITAASFDSARHEIAIAPPRALAVAEGDRVELEIADSEGVIRRRLETTMQAMFSGGTPRVIVVRQGDPPLAPGRYELRIRVPGTDGGIPQLTSYAFEIRP